jgi:hypothetical protein
MNEELVARAKRLGLALYCRPDGTFILDTPLDDEDSAVTEFANETDLTEHLNGFEHAGADSNSNGEDIYDKCRRL